MGALVVTLLLELGAVSHADAGWTSGGPVSFSSVDVLSLALDPTMPGTLYAGLSDGVVKSTDGGARWSAIDLLPSAHVWALAVAQQTPVAVYAGTAGGLFKSVDGGTSWSNTGFLGQALALAVDPQTPATLYAGAWVEGVFKSTDGGAHWAESGDGLTGGITLDSVLVVDPLIPTTVYVTTSAGLFKSTDGGTHWIASNTGLPIRDGFLFLPSLAVDPQTPTTLYVGAWERGVFKSTDGGAHWASSGAGLTYPSAAGAPPVTALAVDPQAPTTVYAGTYGEGVFRSTDGGQTWTPFNTGLTEPWVVALQVSPSGACVHAAAYDRANQAAVFDYAFRSDPCSPPIGLLAMVNQSTFSVGQTVTATVGLTNLGRPGAADLYAGILLPDETTLVLFTSTGGIVFGKIADLASVQPVAAGVPLDAAFAVTAPNFFSYQRTGDEPVGGYVLFLLAAQAGALADGVLTGDEIFGLSMARFWFPP